MTFVIIYFTVGMVLAVMTVAASSIGRAWNTKDKTVAAILILLGWPMFAYSIIKDALRRRK